MNAGGHGSDIAACLVDVDLVDLHADGVVWTVPADALGLRFRGSDVGDDQIVLRARLRLVRGDRTRSEQEIAEIVRWRREHQPGGQNAGSVFVNPVPGEISAAPSSTGSACAVCASARPGCRTSTPTSSRPPRAGAAPTCGP